MPNPVAKDDSFMHWIEELATGKKKYRYDAESSELVELGTGKRTPVPKPEHDEDEILAAESKKEELFKEMALHGGVTINYDTGEVTFGETPKAAQSLQTVYGHKDGKIWKITTQEIDQKKVEKAIESVTLAFQSTGKTMTQAALGMQQVVDGIDMVQETLLDELAEMCAKEPEEPEEQGWRKLAKQKQKKTWRKKWKSG